MAKIRDMQEEGPGPMTSQDECGRERAWAIALDAANRCRQTANELEARGRALDTLAVLVQAAYERHDLDNSTEEALWSILIGIRADILRLR